MPTIDFSHDMPAYATCWGYKIEACRKIKTLNERINIDDKLRGLSGKTITSHERQYTGLDKKIQDILSDNDYDIKSIKKETFMDFDGEWTSYIVNIKEDIPEKDIDKILDIENKISKTLNLLEQKILLELL